MRMVALVFWFFFTSSFVLLCYQYRQSLQNFFSQLQQKEKETGVSLWEHPFLKWPLRVFLILTVVAWSDIVVWGITSVLPLALFLLIIGGKQSLKEGAPYLLILSAFWIICRLLFGITPSEFLSSLNASFLWDVYGVSTHIMQPLIIPLVALFILGIASLVFHIRIFWGIGALLVSTTFPFLMGFIFGAQPKGIDSAIAQTLASFYKASPDALKISLLPQALLLVAGIVLLVRNRIFGGLLWVSIALLLPFSFAPAQVLYANFIAGNSGRGTVKAMADFYAIPAPTFRVLLVLQVAFLLSAFVVACQKKPFLGIFLFVLGLMAPWAYPFSQQVLLPFLQDIPKAFPEIARLYNQPEDTMRILLIPMLLCMLLGFFLLFSKKTSVSGVIFIVLSLLLPWFLPVAKGLYSYLQQQNMQDIASLYQKPATSLQTLFLPMTAFFFLGIFAILKKNEFWGSILILFALFLPWMAEPLQRFFSSFHSQPDHYFQLLVNYYEIDTGSMSHYLPGMILLTTLGFTQLILKKRNLIGLSFIGLAIYLPLWWPFAFEAMMK